MTPFRLHAVRSAIAMGALACAEATAPPGPPSSIAIAPSAVAVYRHASALLTATVRDSTGRELTGLTITWGSADSTIASVTPSGMLTGRALGQTRVYATAAGFTDSAPVGVLLPTAEVAVAPGEIALVPGAALRLTAFLGTASGPLESSHLVSWTSRDTTIATVAFDGTVTAKRVGTTRIIATGEPESDSADILVSTVVFRTVIPGYAFYTCGLRTDGAAYCWGHSGAGGLGTATPDTESHVPVAVAGGKRFESLAVGNETACGLTAGGTAYCWGQNFWGGLGNGSRVGFSNQPVPVGGGHTFTAIGVGLANACALDGNGAAWCWGLDYTDVEQVTPKPVGGTVRLATISVGGFHSCGLTTDSLAYCWGNNLAGELGDSTSTIEPHPFPTPVAGGLRFASVAAGPWATCALTANGVGYCWGMNNYGQLGDSSRVDRLARVQVAGGLSFVSISLGVFGTCGVTAGNSAYCWGINLSGQGGTGSLNEFYSTPSAVTGGLAFQQVRTGEGHTCGVTTGSVAYCWGNSSRGQLGDSSDTFSPVPSPRRVAGQP